MAEANPDPEANPGPEGNPGPDTEENPDPEENSEYETIPEVKESHFVLGPMKLRTSFDNLKTTVFVVMDRDLTDDEESAEVKIGEDCSVRVYGYPKSSSALPRRSHRVKEEYISEENLLYDMALTPRVVLGLESYTSKNKRPKLALALPSDYGGAGQEDYIFKAYSRSKAADVTVMEAVLREGPFRDMKQVDVFISPDQEIPSGLALINVFSSHVCLVNRHSKRKPDTKYPRFYKSKKRRSTIPCAYIETKPLPLVVTYEELTHFDPLEAGLRFEVANKMHFLRCDHESALEVIQHFELHKYGENWPPLYIAGNGQQQYDNESIPPSESEESDEDAVSGDIPIFLPCQSPVTRHSCSEEAAHIYQNEFVTRRCEEDPKEGFMANIGVFGGKPTVGGDWLLQVFICPLRKSQEEIMRDFAKQQQEVVCTLRAFQVVRDLSVSIDLREGWNHEGDKMMEVSKEELRGALNGSSQFLHDICLQHEDTSQTRFRGSIVIRQGMEKTLTLRILTDYEQNPESFLRDDPVQESACGVIPAAETPDNDRPDKSWPLAYSKSRRMCELLDVECIYGNDWRLFAEKIGLDCQTLPVIAYRRAGSPTEHVLTLWRQGHTDRPYDKKTLVEILQEMGRPDVIQDLQLIAPFLKKFMVLTVTDESIQVGWEPGSLDLTHCNLYINRTARMDVLLRKKYTVKIEEKSFTFRELQPGTQYTICIEPLVQLVRGERSSIVQRTRQKDRVAIPTEN
ncbi:uncharacterized protein LOC144870013 [Branchiostoma floridae x Branchiostoma japonicum]